ncbi:TPR-like protein [Apiospora marii]|uniref:TPR-like protein n=1 Tax=Apiospora marii TaxID=335849 RepID=UPI00312EA2C7
MHSEDYPGIFDSITGMIFLGTGPLTLSQVYRTVVAAEVQMQDNVLYSMSQESDVLQETVYNFTRAVGNLQAKDKAPQIFCFYESKPTNVGLVVGRKNMPLEFVATESSSVLPGHKKRMLPLDHFNLNKFENPEDQGYKAVMREIVAMTKASKDILHRRGLDKAPASSMISRCTSQNNLLSLAAPLAKEDQFARRGYVVKTIDNRFQIVKMKCVSSKTHIAVEYAHRFHLTHTGSHVHWVNVTCPIQFEHAYNRIAEDLHLSKTKIKINGVLAAVRDALRQDVGGQWLIVLDGLEDMKLMRNRLVDYLPKVPSRAQILVTTRDKQIASDLAKERTECIITVSQLTDEDASFMLLGRPKVSVNVARKLRGSAGTLTLAYLFKKTDVPWQDYLDMMGLKTNCHKSNSERRPQRAWQLVFELLQKDHGDAAELLLTVASLYVQTVSSAFFNRIEFSVLTPVLVEYGMIEPSADRRLVNVTPLIRRCVQTWLRENEKKGTDPSSNIV